MTEAIVANSNPNVIPREMSFRFKKDKLGNKRANVKCESVPVPSAQGIVSILETGGKGLELLIEVCGDTVRGVLGEFVGEDASFNPETFDFNKVSWEAIANMPKEDRRSSAIPSDVWEGFVTDYLAVMPGLTGKSVEQVTLATEIFVKKMAPIKSRKGALGKLKEQLAMYAQTSKAEEFQEILDLLTRRTDAYLAADDPAVLEAAL
jgi:hypothetical protein